VVSVPVDLDFCLPRGGFCSSLTVSTGKRLHDAMMKESGINEVNTILFRLYGEKSIDTSLRWSVYV